MQDSKHISDELLILAADGELPPNRESMVRAHLKACWTCRARRQELQDAVVDFVQAYHRASDTVHPPVEGPRALLKAQLAQLAPAVAIPNPRLIGSRVIWGVLAAAACVAFALTLQKPPVAPTVFSSPDSRLTPGAAVLTSSQQLCSQALVNNKDVPESIQRKVFQEYGISSVPRDTYEVDYLITPALGGSDDIHNLWPHSYRSTVWNAHVKDELEDRLRGMVCDGSLDLATAQQEIAGNWIAAYKQYYHTDTPVTR